MAAAPAMAETVYKRIRRVRLVPVIRVQDSRNAEWLDAGAFAVGIGSDLTAPGDIAARVGEVLDQ
jgi:2-keto-3-deoxy-6-phosphogluconate aldolase